MSGDGQQNTPQTAPIASSVQRQLDALARPEAKGDVSIAVTSGASTPKGMRIEARVAAGRRAWVGGYASLAFDKSVREFGARVSW